MEQHRDPSWLEGLIAHLQVAVYRTTPDGRIVIAHPSLARLLGAVSVDELTDVHVRTLYADPGARQHMVVRVEDGVEIMDDEIEMRRLDARPIWIRLSSRAVVDEGGNVLYYEGAGACESIFVRGRFVEVCRSALSAGCRQRLQSPQRHRVSLSDRRTWGRRARMDFGRRASPTLERGGS